MRDLMEHMYCSQQINIPPNLPFILKQYAKAAIRTQPHDLLYWSAAYFRAKANDLPPPVKERLEYPPVDTPSRLSPGFLKVLHRQLGEKEEVPEEILYEKWLGVCLVKESLDNMMKVGSLSGNIPWLKFVAIAAGHLCPSLSRTMIMICEVITEEPEGGSAMIPVETFVYLYKYLARMDCGPRVSKPPPLESATTATSFVESESTVCADYKEERKMSKEGIDGEDRDSTAGLMVWPDVQPPEKKDSLRSPRPTDELGATSELGVEVLDDAKGPVQELVTLYPAQEPIQSDLSIPVPSSPSLQTRSIGENILSHSSLKENEDWIKVDAKELDDEILKKKTLTTEDTSITSKDDTGTKSGEFEEKPLDIDEETVDMEGKSKDKTIDMNESEGGLTTEKSADKSVLDSKKEPSSLKLEEKGDENADDIVERDGETLTDAVEPDNVKSEMTANKLSPSDISKKSDKDEIQTPERIPLGEEVEPSVDSILELGESVTVQRFVRDDLDQSTMMYSTGEIRKGYVGDKSELKIERLSSENVVKEATTVQQLELLDEDSTSTLLPTVKMSSDVSEDSRSFIVLVDHWQDVPGIGPVIPDSQILAVVEYMLYWANKQEGMVMPRNIHHILCPPLDLPPPNPDSDTGSHY